MSSKKVIIKRKETTNHLPKEIRAGAIKTIGSIYKGRQPLKGVEGEEEKKYLNGLLDVAPGHLEWDKHVRTFWADMRLKVPYAGVELEVGMVDDSAEDPYPIDVMDYLTYRWLKVHRLVADSKEEMDEDGRKLYYIYDPNRERNIKNATVQLRKDADKEFVKVSGETEKMYQVFRALGLGNPDTMMKSDVENSLFDFKDANPNKFLLIARDKNLEVIAEIRAMVEASVIRKIENQYLFEDAVIGEDEQSTIAYFKNKANTGALNAMRALLKSAN